MPVSRKLGRLEKAFFLGLALYFPLHWTAPATPLTAVLPPALFVLGVVLLVRYARIFSSRILWRLRNLRREAALLQQLEAEDSPAPGQARASSCCSAAAWTRWID